MTAAEFKQLLLALQEYDVNVSSFCCNNRSSSPAGGAGSKRTFELCYVCQREPQLHYLSGLLSFCYLIYETQPVGGGGQEEEVRRKRLRFEGENRKPLKASAEGEPRLPASTPHSGDIVRNVADVCVSVAETRTNI